MISPVFPQTISNTSLLESTHTVWNEVTVRSCREIAGAVAKVMSLMSTRPFTVSDGMAVQHKATQALKNAFQLQQRDHSNGVQLRFSVSSQNVFVEVETPHTQVVQAEQTRRRPEKEATQIQYSAVNFGKSLGPDHRDLANVFSFSRRRGQRVTDSGPPVGYDFQI